MEEGSAITRETSSANREGKDQANAAVAATTATASGGASATPTFIPAAALKRFADDLGNTNPATNRFLQINRDRVQTFIEKPARPPGNSRPSASSSTPQRKYKVPGIYQYSYPTVGNGSSSSSSVSTGTNFLHLQELPEFQNTLGSRSRFGEGDGSFFDRWLNSDTIASKQVLDKDGLPIMRFSLQEVHTGYKRHIAEAKQNKPPPQSNYVQPYAERRKARLEKDQIEREAQEKEAARLAAASMTFELPPEDYDKIPNVAKKLTAVERENYFGSGARQSFFEYYQHLSRRRATDDILFDQSALATSRTSEYDYSPSPSPTAAVQSEKALAPSSSLMAKPYDPVRNASIIKERFARKASANMDDTQEDYITDRRVQIEHITHEDEDEPRMVSARITYSRMRQRYDPAGTQASEEEKQLLLDHLLGLESRDPLDDSSNGNRPVSARSKYLKGCVALGLRPQPSLVIRKEITTLLNISSLGIGDDMAVVLSDALHLLPALEGLLLADNHLSDYSLVPLIERLSSCKNLSRLDLSNNLFERDALRALQLFLASPYCLLTDLKLQKLNLDDLAVHRLVEAITINTNSRGHPLRQLDLSYNELGSHDFSVLSRQHKLAGEALGILLSMETCRLTSLKLAWNKIRGKSGAALVQALKVNRSLTHLDLNYNGLGVEGGEALGGALHFNTALKTLHLTHNNITARPAIVIMSGIKSCESLTEVDMSENPIGEEGARGILVLNITYGQRVKVEIRNCSVKMKDPTCWFHGPRDKGQLTKTDYNLDMSKPYDRAVCMELMRALARDHDLTFTKCRMIGPDEPASSTGVELPLVLYTGPTVQALEVKERQRSFVEGGLYRVESNYESVKSLFRETASRIFEQIDFEGNGGLDRQDIAHILDQLGFNSAWDMVDNIMGMYDIDGTGKVEEDEFVSFLLDLKRNYEKESVSSKIIRYFTTDTLPTNPTTSTTTKPPALFIPSEKGRLILNVEAVQTQSGPPGQPGQRLSNPTAGGGGGGGGGGSSSSNWMASAVSLGQVQSFLDAAKGLSDKDKLFEHALQSTKLTMTEARPIFHTLIREIGSVLRVLLQLLPYMATQNDARMLIAYVTNHDFQQIQHLKYLLGPLYRVLIGIPNGYYQLHLNEPNDKEVLARLHKLSKEASEARRKAERADTSQYGNWMSFRNVHLNGKPLACSDDWLEHQLPDKGRLDFDFVLQEMLSMKEKEIPNLRLFRLLTALGIVKEDRRKRIFTKLRINTEEGRNTSKGNGQRRFETMPFAAQEISENLYSLYGAAGFLRKLRPYTVDVQQDEANVLKRMKTLKRMNAAALTNSGKAEAPNSSLAAVMKAGQTTGVAEKKEEDEVDDRQPSPMLGNTKRHQSELFKMPNSTQGMTRTTVGGYAGIEFKSTDMYGEHLKDLLADYSLPPAFIAARYLDAFEVILAGRFLTCAQVGLILERFPFGNTALDAYGTYRVELVVSLFSRIIDKINFEYVTKELDNGETAMLYFRLGWLNVWNPLKPEGNICLDLSRHEERQIARMLVTLNYVETGETWQEPKFKENRESEPIPDWSLPHSWYAEESLPMQGILSLNYFSGKGMEINGCQPNIAYRMSLMSMVLALPYEEDYQPLIMDVVVEEAETYVQKAGMALSFYEQNQSRVPVDFEQGEDDDYEIDEQLDGLAADNNDDDDN